VNSCNPGGLGRVFAARGSDTGRPPNDENRSPIACCAFALNLIPTLRLRRSRHSTLWMSLDNDPNVTK